jgi:hypothetical protein
VRITREQAENFYGVHKARPFFGELGRFHDLRPVVVQVLEGDNAIAKYRDIMGATDPAKARRTPSARSTPSRSARTRCMVGRRRHGRKESRSSFAATKSSAAVSNTMAFATLRAGKPGPGM